LGLSVQDYTYIGIYGLGGESTSTGIDTLRDQLNALGLSGFVINQENAVASAMSLLAADTNKKIVFGYSMGATDAIDIARQLIVAGHDVDLLFTMDPHLRRDQVDGVKRHINIWQDNNIFLIKPFFPVQPVAEAQGYLENINAPDVKSHGDLDNTPWVQKRFINEVEDLLTTPDAPDFASKPQQKISPPWIIEVNKHLGLHEVHDNAVLTEYLQSDGTTLGDPAENPWCGDLVETVFKNTLPDEVIPNQPYWARNWQHFGVKCEPKMYALLVFTRGNGGHVGWYVGETDTHYIVRGGNQSNRVTDTPYAKSRLIDARWPRTYKAQRQQSIIKAIAEAPEVTAFHKAFFDAVRKPLFHGRMGQSQVDGMKMTIAEWFKRPDLTDERWLAYMFATAWLETDRTMQAISEYGDRAYFTRMYGIRGARPDKARRLGNIHAGDGAKFHGRGKPMITGRGNYQKADQYVGDFLGVNFEDRPSEVLVGNRSDLIMFSGMIKGWFTGKKLSDYFDGDLEDPINARRIVNGTDRADDIADAYEHFLDAVDAGFEARKRVLEAQVFDPISRDEAVVEKPVVTGIPRNLSEATSAALIEISVNAMMELKRRNITTASQFKSELNQNLTSLHDGQQDEAIQNRPLFQTTEGIKTMNPLALINGSKMYIVSAIAIMAGVSEGLLGLDVPGIDVQENWLEVVLGGSGFGALSHRLAKLLKAFAN
jgi:uncharacterized protein (TIGR02594 family)